MKMLRLVSVGQKGWIRSFFLWLLWHGVACRSQSTPKRLRCGHVPEMQGLLEWWPLQNLCATGSGLWCYAGANVIDHQQWVETGSLEENYSIVEREKRTTTHIYNLYMNYIWMWLQTLGRNIDQTDKSVHVMWSERWHLFPGERCMCVWLLWLRDAV